MDTGNSQRRSILSLGLLWMSMITGFPPLLVAFDWYKAGLGLVEVLFASLVGVVITLAYCLPAAYLGASSGKSYAHLIEETFGAKRACALSAVVAVIFFAWFGLLVNLFAESFCGLTRIADNAGAVAIVIALLLTFLNQFGFRGVMATCAYLAAPILLAWVMAVFSTLPPATVTRQFCHQSATLVSPEALALVSPFVIGYAIYGNEPDFWRFAKPTWLSVVASMLFALLANVFFGIVSWLVCCTWHPATPADLIALMNKVTFGDQTWLVAIVLITSSAALSNANLFVAALSLEHVRAYFSIRSPQGTLAALAILAACTTTDTETAIRLIPMVSSITLPTITVILIFDRLWRRRFSVAAQPSLAGVALIFALLVGIITTGELPGCCQLKFGISSVNAWLTALLLLSSLRFIERLRYCQAVRDSAVRRRA